MPDEKVLTQADYDALCADLIERQRGGHPIADDGVQMYRPGDGTLTVSIMYSDEQPVERLIFGTDVNQHPIGA